MSRRLLVGAVIAACSALLITGCTTTLQGKAVSVFDDPFHVAGMPATDGPTGLRPDAHGPVRDVEGTDNGKIDELAANAVSDIEEYWSSAYGETFDGAVHPGGGADLVGRQRFRRHPVLRREHIRTRQRRVLLRRRDHRLGPRRAAARAAKGVRRHGRDDGARPRIRPRRAAPGRAEQQEHPDAGGRTTGRLLRRCVHALGRRGQFAAVLAVHG